MAKPHPDTVPPDPMSQADQQKAFTSDLEDLILRYRAEFELTLASVVGCLEVMKTHLIHEILEENE